MSKKKACGNTMTLKDFHGGSIPSDLPLPSAPSLTVRPSDRSSGFERASSWGNRSMPHTSPPTKCFDEKAPFFTHTAHNIGRSFDEDERKPLDGVSAPRRTVTAHNNSWGTTSAWSAPNAVSKLVHASALDKVNSATWHSKTPLHQPQHVEVVASSKVGNGVDVNNGDSALGGEKDHCDEVLARHAERGLAIDDDRMNGGGGRNELVGSRYSDARPRSMAYRDADGVQVPRSFGKLDGSDLQHSMPSEPTERPKLKLLPRTKALESSEPSVPDYEQVDGETSSLMPVSDGTGIGKEAGQRPKLNLKPRSQPLEQLEGNPERDRSAIFGGARPRELVLKLRGIDDAAINNSDVVEHSNRIEYTTARAEKLPDHSHQTRYGEKNEGALHDWRTGKQTERKEQRVDVERVEAQRRNWHSDNLRNMQETDRQQVSERQPSPETWRKPAEQPKSSADTVSMSHGKAASAVELAQAFSRSVSDPRVNDRVSGQSGLNTSRTQVPFSRLVGSTPRPQINGY